MPAPLMHRAGMQYARSSTRTESAESSIRSRPAADISTAQRVTPSLLQRKVASRLGALLGAGAHQMLATADAASPLSTPKLSGMLVWRPPLARIGNDGRHGSRASVAREGRRRC